MILDPEWNGDICILRWRDGENRFRRRLDRSLARAARRARVTIDGPLALVVVGEGKFFSNGLDLDWMGAQPR